MLNTITSYTKQCLVKECLLTSKQPQQFCDLEAHVGILESNPAEVTFESTQSGLVDTKYISFVPTKQAYYSGPRITCPWCVLMNISRQAMRGSL